MAIKTKIGAFLFIVFLVSSVYYFMPDKVRIDIENTRTKYSVWADTWDLAATEYLNLFDGTTKMRAKSRELISWEDETYAYTKRISIWKDDIATIQTYIFLKSATDVEQLPIDNILECENCEGKIVHYEIRDILYDGPTQAITSPFSFGKNMQIEWQAGEEWAKVYQQKIASDKIIIRYKPTSNYETYKVRLFDPYVPSFMAGNGGFYFPFDENDTAVAGTFPGVDLGSGQINCSEVGGTATWNNNTINGTYVNGSYGRLDIPKNVYCNIDNLITIEATDDWHIRFWYEIKETPSASGATLYIRDDGNNQISLSQNINGSIQWTSRENIVYYRFGSTGGNLMNGGPHLLVYTYDKSANRVYEYIDNVLQVDYAGPVGGYTINPNDRLSMGDRNPGGLATTFDDVVFQKTFITATEVQKIWEVQNRSSPIEGNFDIVQINVTAGNNWWYDYNWTDDIDQASLVYASNDTRVDVNNTGYTNITNFQNTMDIVINVTDGFDNWATDSFTLYLTSAAPSVDTVNVTARLSPHPTGYDNETLFEYCKGNSSAGNNVTYDWNTTFNGALYSTGTFTTNNSVFDNGSTGWDLVNAEFLSNFSVATETSGTRGINLFSNKSLMYVLSANSTPDTLLQYVLSSETNSSSATLRDGFSFPDSANYVEDMVIDSDEENLYVVDWAVDYLYHFEMVHNNISTLTQVENVSLLNLDNNMRGITMNDNKSTILLLGGEHDMIYKMELSTAGNISTMTNTQNLSITNLDIDPRSIKLFADGFKILFVGNVNDNIYQLDLSSQLDLSTAVNTYNISTEDITPQGIDISYNSSQLYVSGAFGNKIAEYNMYKSDITYFASGVEVNVENQTLPTSGNWTLSCRAYDGTNYSDWNSTTTEILLSSGVDYCLITTNTIATGQNIVCAGNQTIEHANFTLKDSNISIGDSILGKNGYYFIETGGMIN